MTLTDDHTETGAPTAPRRRTGRWIDDWRPEDPEFWETTGRRVARRNLIWSIFAEHLGFSVWLIWSVSSAFLVSIGFEFTPQQLFFLVALPEPGRLRCCALPYTFAVAEFGGRNWTMASAAAAPDPDARVRLRGDQPEHALLGVLPDRGDGRLRWRQLRLLDGEHQLLLPLVEEGHGARPQRGRRQPRRRADPVPPAGHRGRRRRSSAWSRRPTGGVHLERAAWVYAGLAWSPRRRGVPLHGQPGHREVRPAGAARSSASTSRPG